MPFREDGRGCGVGDRACPPPMHDGRQQRERNESPEHAFPASDYRLEAARPEHRRRACPERRRRARPERRRRADLNAAMMQPRTEATMKRFVQFLLTAAAVMLAATASAQPVPPRATAYATAPDIPYESVPNFLKMPPNIYLG